jgi:alkaline phosphatase
MNKKAGISWGSSAHTAIKEPVYSIGPGTESFSGYLDNTENPINIGRLMGMQE